VIGSKLYRFERLNQDFNLCVKGIHQIIDLNSKLFCHPAESRRWYKFIEGPLQNKDTRL
jgi:hypothetical protein